MEYSSIRRFNLSGYLFLGVVVKVRIGIDVGGTFTDAVLMDNSSYDILAQSKVPTTHDAPEGVTKGIIEALHNVLEESNVAVSDVVFIAHGTTQATNALLEGDVVKVGIVALGNGFDGIKTRLDTSIEPISLSNDKYINSKSVYIDTNSDNLSSEIEKALSSLKDDGIEAVVAAEAFSVDKPDNEKMVQNLSAKINLPATATSDISKLYGLKVRTRTAVVNASIMPRMLETADSTERSIEAAEIKSPLMVMRCDGGVMSVSEMRNRPILTILSGPAAGVAGALMYEKLSDGLFFEVGGTSTDISCIKDGKVMIKYAEVGGHKTYLNSLDVRTVGIGGGSLILGSGGSIDQVGPRSAHIAGLQYEVYTDRSQLNGAKLFSGNLGGKDHDFYYLKTQDGKVFALTLAGAANVAGYVKSEDYAAGNIESAELAWGLLGEKLGISAVEAAEKALALAAKKNNEVVQQILKDYRMNSEDTLYVGGGGGASVVVPHLAKSNRTKYKISKNSSIISTIGVALAMVRDTVERTVINPTEEDIRSIRLEAERKALENGAKTESINIEIEVDSQRNLLRAVATGATELRSKDMLFREKSDSDLISILSKSFKSKTEEVIISGRTSGFLVAQVKRHTRRIFGLVKSTKHPLKIIDKEGVIRLQRPDSLVDSVTCHNWKKSLYYLVEELTEYNDGGANLPNIYLLVASKMINLSGLNSIDQMYQVGELELTGVREDESIVLVGSPKV